MKNTQYRNSQHKHSKKRIKVCGYCTSEEREWHWDWHQSPMANDSINKTISFFFKFYNILLVLPYIDKNLPWVYMCSPSWTPLPPPSPYHPSGSSQCTSLKHPVSCTKPGLAICFIYGNIHVSMHSPKSSHPRPLPQSPKDCSIHLCLFCYLAYRVIATIFLNSIYMC